MEYCDYCGRRITETNEIVSVAQFVWGIQILVCQGCEDE